MLADTSVWIDHFRHGNATLARHLEKKTVWCHPSVIGELACGNLARRSEVLVLLHALPRVPEARYSEALTLIDNHRLMGRGIGWIDVHLLASTRLGNTTLWTLDKRLDEIAQELGIAWQEHEADDRRQDPERHVNSSEERDPNSRSSPARRGSRGRPG